MFSTSSELNGDSLYALLSQISLMFLTYALHWVFPGLPLSLTPDINQALGNRLLI